VLDELLPPSAAVVETRGDLLEASLFPEEEKLVAQAVEKRQREFITGRACARAALVRLGAEPQAIPAGPKGEPQWPAGIVGSITHCGGYRACALARQSDLVTLGVDAEIDAALPGGLLADIALPEERGRLEALARVAPGINWDRLLFSAKESVYKAWFPLAERWLGFEDASLSFDPQQRTFSARLLVPGPALDGHALSGFSGSWLVRDGIVATAIALPARVAS
jgi:enterobactin synthetase component D / holo-[acyl-carrier protein] synthase